MTLTDKLIDFETKLHKVTFRFINIPRRYWGSFFSM